MAYLKVENAEHLIRDTRSRAILNTDRKAIEQYHLQRHAYLKRKEEIARQNEEINNLKDELQDIKQMLSLLLSKGQ